MTESGGLRVLLIGATGVVGPEALRLALAEPRFGAIVAPTRRPLPPHPKLTNPLVDFGNLRAADLWWSVDGVVATLGTTQGTAGLPEAFRAVDHGYTLAVARLAHAAGATRFALTSSLGADPAALPRPVVRSGCSRRCLDSGAGADGPAPAARRSTSAVAGCIRPNAIRLWRSPGWARDAGDRLCPARRLPAARPAGADRLRGGVFWSCRRSSISSR